ncbi:MAG: ldi 1, partial [Aeromicrobium sp.]|nr:ldi 1 [Aeromicrobium sp.]
MTIETRAVSGSDRLATVLLRTPRTSFGPVTLRRMRRAIAVYAVVWLVGLAPSLLGGSAGLAVGGLGLAAPGGGFLAAGHPVLGVITLLVFVVSLVVWWFIGAVVIPPLIWVLAAVLAGLQADPVDGAGRVAVLAAGPLVIAVSTLTHLLRHRAQVRAGAAINDRLARVEFVISGPPALEAGLPVAESSAEDLARLRYGIDLALQPIDRFDGFTHLDQYREAA